MPNAKVEDGTEEEMEEEAKEETNDQWQINAASITVVQSSSNVKGADGWPYERQNPHEGS